MSERLTVLCLIVFLGFTRLAQATEKSTLQLVQPKPNIVLFITDDHGYWDAGCYGAEVVRTPSLDALAQEGIRFTRAFANTPNCVPSRAVINTGLMPARNGAHPNHSKIDRGIKTLPSYMQELGYHTVLAGKDHVWPRSAYAYEFIKKQDEDDHVVDSILAAQTRKADQPLFLVVATDDPHVPWPENNGYDPAEIDLPPYLVDTEVTRQVRAKYYTDVTRADRALGECLKSLKKHGLDSTTLFMYVSDHGPQWPHGKWNLYDLGIRVPMVVRWPGKVKAGTTSDAMLPLVDFLPTVIEVAGGTAPPELDGRSYLPVLLGEKTTHRDTIYSTYTADTRYGDFNYYPMRSLRTKKYKYIMNLEPEETYTTHITNAQPEDGRDYWESWLKKAETDTNAAKLVYQYQHRPAEELYDLENDPYELRNIAEEADQQEVVRSFREDLVSWMEDQNDQMGLTLYFTNIKYSRAEQQPGNPILPVLTVADPQAAIFGKKYYLYPSTYEPGKQDDGSFSVWSSHVDPGKRNPAHGPGCTLGQQ